MGDIFKEQLVARKRTLKDIFFIVLIIISAIILLFIAIPFLGGFFLIGAALIIFGAYWFIQSFNIEYEYILTNNELDIDKITNKSKRKKILSVSVKDFDVMAHVEDNNHAHEFNGFDKVIDYSSGEIKSNTYAAMFNYKSQKVKMIFEPNEEILKSIFHYIPRKLYIKK